MSHVILLTKGGISFMIKETLPQHMKPLDTIKGFPVRPGLYEYFGAWPFRARQLHGPFPKCLLL